MGHTLIATLGDSFANMISLAGLFANNKIPYRKNCDRRAANRIMPYHITLFHWDNHQDIFYLPHMDEISFQPCSVNAEQPVIMQGSGDSKLLYLKVSPGEGFEALCDHISQATGRPVDSFLHITISVSKDSDLIERQYRALAKTLKYPIELPLQQLELYRIWNPLERVKVIAPPEPEDDETEEKK